MKLKHNMRLPITGVVEAYRTPILSRWLIELGVAMCVASLLATTMPTVNALNRQNRSDRESSPIRIKTFATGLASNAGGTSFEVTTRMKPRSGGQLIIRAGLLYETSDKGSILLDEGGISIRRESSL